MNKITTTAGLLALGAVSLKAEMFAPAEGSQQAAKPWTVSATLRGFYDDNYTTSPKSGAGVVGGRRDSFGFEVSPSANINMIMDQTAFSLGYVYSLRWYEDRDDLGLSATDQSHQVSAKLSHAFSPRYKIDVSDSFALFQEPNLADPGILTTYYRTEGDNIRNNVAGSFSAGITDNLAVVLGYSNLFYDYDQEANDISGFPFFGVNSRSALLDRVEHQGTIDIRQVLLPKTVGVAGYRFQYVDYTSGDLIGLPVPGLAYRPDARDSYSHYMYLGVDQQLLSNLNGSVRVGAQYTKYDKLDQLPALIAQPEDSNWSPYVDANLTWTYMPGSYAQLGVKHQRSQTDVGVVLAPTAAPILDAESTTVYGSLNHRIFGGVGHGLVASLVGQYQNSSYDNNVAPDFSDNYFLAGVNLTYEINRFLATEVGYNYDRLDSDLDSAAAGGIPRSFTRNRVYIGVRASY